MSDITVPAGVELVELSHGEGHDQPIAACHMTRGAYEEDEDSAEAEAAAAEGGAEPAAE